MLHFKFCRDSLRQKKRSELFAKTILTFCFLVTQTLGQSYSKFNRLVPGLGLRPTIPQNFIKIWSAVSSNLDNRRTDKKQTDTDENITSLAEVITLYCVLCIHRYNCHLIHSSKLNIMCHCWCRERRLANALRVRYVTCGQDRAFVRGSAWPHFKSRPLQ